VRRRFRIPILAILLTAVLSTTMPPGAFADPDPTPEPTSSPTPSPSPTSEPSPDPEPTPTPTPSPSDDPGPSPSPSPPPADHEKPKERGDQSREKDQRERRKRKKDLFELRGPRNTAKLISILTALTPRGTTLEEALLKVVGPFPVAGLAWWGDDWHAPRCCPFAHLHQGLDIFAPFGTPLVAAADGYISQKVNSPAASGLGLEITDARGIQYFYAHLSAFEPGIQAGTRVEVGQVIGYVGASGNARGTLPHLHFERQPDGVPAPPKPWVDRWLRIAERKAMRLVQETTGKKVNLERLTFRLTRLFDLMDAERSDIDDAVTEAPQELLALSGLPPASTYDMARDTAGTMAWEIDWGEQAIGGLTTGIQEYQQEMTEQLLTGILEDPGALATFAGLLPGSRGVAFAEGIGDPTAPVATQAVE
jgi:murein DD-endopeptidase MepM/ murein hydrolase activator NlpD